MTANRRRLGRTSRKSSNRLPVRSVAWSDRPVTLPPGRARLATRPPPTGSLAAAKMIGIADVAAFAARVALPGVTLHRQIGRFLAAQDAIDVTGRKPVIGGQAGAIDIRPPASTKKR